MNYKVICVNIKCLECTHNLNIVCNNLMVYNQSIRSSMSSNSTVKCSLILEF
nr:MAG TPA: hypothetical protein [Caudoviricetes sp.]